MVAMSGGEERAGGTDDMLVKEQRTRKMPARSGFLCTPNSLGLPPLAGPGPRGACLALPYTFLFNISSISTLQSTTQRHERHSRPKKKKDFETGNVVAESAAVGSKVLGTHCKTLNVHEIPRRAGFRHSCSSHLRGR